MLIPWLKLPKFLSIILLASVALNSNWLAANPAPRILILGDSLSAAYNLPVDAGWVTLLTQRLAQQNSPWQVINASISGETTSGGRSRLPNLLTKHQPQILIIALGSNDGLRGLQPSLVATNIQALIDQGHNSGSQVILIGSLLPRNYGAYYLNQFEQVFPKLAQENNLSLVPFLLAGVADNPKLMQADGLHPTAEAQPIILENVWLELAAKLN